MKQILHAIWVLSLIPTASLGQGQPWALPSTKWTYSLEAIAASGYLAISVEGDTIIDGKQCTILSKKITIKDYYTGNIDTAFMGSEITYIDNNVVYNYRFGQFFTLYDFNAVAGSQWEVAGDLNVGSGCDSFGTVTVDSTDIVVINSIPLKCLYVTINYAEHWQFTDKIIERIGCVGYMLPSPYCPGVANDGYWPEPLRCYQDSIFGIYETGIKDSCNWLPTGISATEHVDSRPQIWPNPVDELLFIRVPQLMRLPENNPVSVSSLSGQVYFEGPLNKGVNVLQVGNLPPGIYIIGLKASDSTYWFKVAKAKF